MLDEQLTRRRVPPVEGEDRLLLDVLFERRRQRVAAADLKNRGRLQTEDGQDALAHEHDLRLTQHDNSPYRVEDF